jgi:hypothetical protein
MRRTTTAALGLLVSAALVGCDRPPSTERIIGDVARLETHVVPLVDELDVHFYLDERWTCHSILYSRGEFRDGDDSCGSPTESYVLFDVGVRSDFDRIKAALSASGAGIHRFEASIGTDGALRSISFRLGDSSIRWNWFYVDDPNNSITKSDGPNPPTYARINDRWWLLTEIDD